MAGVQRSVHTAVKWWRTAKDESLTMAGQRSRLQAISRRCFAITALLLLALIVLPLARNTRTLTPTERRLVGSWTTPSPQGPRITRVWAFTSDRRVMIRDISDETGAGAGEA